MSHKPTYYVLLFIIAGIFNAYRCLLFARSNQNWRDIAAAEHTKAYDVKELMASIHADTHAHLNSL